MKKIINAVLFLALSGYSWAQQPQANDVANTEPIFRLNAKLANGVAPGYWPTAGSGLTLNLSAGTAFCSGAIQSYAGGTLTMTGSATNQVYLNTAASCAPAVKTSGWSVSDIPVAIVVAGSSSITGITDVRTMFNPGSGSGGGLGDPGSNGVIKRTALNTTALALSSDIIALFSGTCNGTTYMRADGSCQVPSGSGNATQIQGKNVDSSVGSATAGQELIVSPDGTKWLPQSKPWYDARDYGCVDDNGTSDNASCVNSLIAKACNSPADHRSIYFPRVQTGKYAVKSQVQAWKVAGGVPCDGLTLHGDGNAASIIQYQGSANTSLDVIRSIGAWTRIFDLSISTTADVRSLWSYDGDPAIGRSSLGEFHSVVLDCGSHKGDGLRIGFSGYQADQFKGYATEVDNCTNGNATSIWNQNALDTEFYGLMAHNNHIVVNTRPSGGNYTGADAYVHGGSWTNNDLGVYGGAGTSVLVEGTSWESNKRAAFDLPGSVTSDTIRFENNLIRTQNTTRPANVTASCTASSPQIVLSSAGFIEGDWLVLATCGASGVPLKSKIKALATDLVTATLQDNAGSTQASSAVGFYGWLGGVCTVSTTVSSAAVTFSQPWCMMPGEYVAIYNGDPVTGTQIFRGQISSCSDSTHCTLASNAGATVALATWGYSAANTLGFYGQNYFDFNEVGPYILRNNVFASSTFASANPYSSGVFEISNNNYVDNLGNPFALVSNLAPPVLSATSGNIYGGGPYTAMVSTIQPNPSATATVNAASPDVSASKFLITANTSVTGINNFSGGREGDVVTLIFNDANTYLNPGSTLKVCAQASYSPGQLPTTYQFILKGTVWYQLCDYPGPLNVPLVPQSSGFTDLGTSALPFGNLWLTGQVKIGGSQISSSNLSDVNNLTKSTSTPTVNTAACIKSVGPPVVIGYCSTALSGGPPPTCTCN